MPERLPLSAFIICKDEAEYIENCIRSLELCSEIVVVDSGSRDDTVAIVERLAAEGFPIRFMHQDWLGYAKQKQFALEQCTQPWCINIDADERFDDDLKAALPALMAAPETVDGWKIHRRLYLIGYGYPPKSVTGSAILRLVRRGRAQYDLAQRVHEGMLLQGEVRKATTGSLLHYRPLIIDDQILKENAYSTLKADQIVAAGKGPRLFRLVFNPPMYFVRLYFLHQLWRCGWPGFIQACIGSVYSFLTEAKIYQRDALKRMPPHDDLDRPAGRG